MSRAKKLLLCLIAGSVWIGGEDSLFAADLEATSGGYLTEAGTVWVKRESGLAVLTPPWDPHNLHVLELRFDSSFTNVWWYHVPDRNVYVALDHRGHESPAVFVWIYYRDKADHWQLRHYWAKVRGITDADAAGLLGGSADGGAKAAKPMTEEMPEPDDGPPDAEPPSVLPLFPEEPVPDSRDADDSSRPSSDDLFQAAPPTVPPPNEIRPPFSRGLVPPGSR